MLGEGLFGFLENLLRQEEEILTTAISRANGSAAREARSFAIVYSYIAKNSELIDFHESALAEPIVGHGDFKTQNLVH